MKILELEATERTELGNKNKALRNKGFIPAVIYGHDIKAHHVSIAKTAFLKTIGTSAGSNAIITLKVGSKDFPVLAHEIQKDAVTDQILHIDFLKINMKEKIKTRVHIELKGVPIGVKDDGGILVQKLREVEIKVLPTNIPEKLEIDITGLKLGDSLSVSDLKVGKDIEFLTAGTEVVVYVEVPAKEEEVAPAEVAAVTPEAGAVPAEGAVKAAPGVADKTAKAAPAGKTEAKKPEAKK